MSDLIEFFTFAWLLAWAVYAGAQIARGGRDSIYFTILAFVFFFGVPLGLNVFVGRPSYLGQPGFRVPAQDPQVTVIYCIYVAAIPVLWWRFGRTHVARRDHDGDARSALRRISARLRPVLYLAIVSPLFVVLAGPEPERYLSYALVVRDVALSDAVLAYNNFVALFALLSLVSIAALLLIRQRVRPLDVLLLIPWAGFDIWVHGKRSIVAAAITFTLYVGYERGLVRRARLAVAVVVAVLLMVGFSTYYQANVRHSTAVVKLNDSYENGRLDWGRDGVTKMTLYAESNPNTRQVLEFRGQSFLFDVTAFVPRSIWPGKPWPYAVYATSLMLRREPGEIGWGITTSFLEEAIANLGWLGMLIGPLWFVVICRVGDGQNNRLVRLLTTLVSVLFLVLHFIAFAPFVMLWIAMVVWARSARRRAVRRRLATAQRGALSAGLL